jgi:nucleoside-diphosphate-sugar epimerase
MIVITGASGFMGRHLFDELTALNTLVKGYSRTNNQFLLVKNYSDIIVDEPSTLIHLAQTSTINSHIDVDFEITELRKLLEKKWEKIIYLSSASLYGVSRLCSHKVTSPLVIENDYQRVKAASEEMVKSLKGIIFRATNVYGVNMNNKTIIKDIHSQLGKKMS